jgi:phytoene dehydrogenase-like protein
VIERAGAPGGRCVTRRFAPGFFASPYADELAAIPPAIFRDLDLARRGAVLMPDSEPRGAIDGVREAVIARVLADAAVTPSRAWLRRARPASPWPGEELATRASIACDGEGSGDPDRGALALLAGPPGGLPRGGLGALGAALRCAAEDAGAEISCGLEVTDIRRRRGPRRRKRDCCEYDRLHARPEAYLPGAVRLERITEGAGRADRHLSRRT